MRRYLNYFKYLFMHKYYVTVECFKCNLYWRGLKHDMSKFMPLEFIAYAKFFYNEDGTKKQIRNATGYYKPTDTGSLDFDLAWLHHTHHNDHHWQYWTVVDTEVEGNIKKHDMPKNAIREMICDWIGAGKAQGTPDTYRWYKTNRDKMIISDRTKELIEINLSNRGLWIGGE